jgi:uncharacterized protein
LATEVYDNPDRSRYDITAEGVAAGFAQYVRKGRRVIFVHTQVDDAFEGKGIGSALAKGALDDVRARGLVALPLCPFIASYIERHPAYDDLVDHELLGVLTDEHR